MSQFRSGLRPLWVALVAVLATTALAAPTALAGGNTNADDVSVLFRVRGGDAIAVAECLNAAKGGGNTQTNYCVYNTATAVGGNVTIKNVKVIAASTNKKYKGGGGAVSVDFEVRGGDATAVAACLNLAGGGGNQQTNTCDNFAFAQGGDVTVKNIKIVGVSS